MHFTHIVYQPFSRVSPPSFTLYGLMSYYGFNTRVAYRFKTHPLPALNQELSQHLEQTESWTSNLGLWQCRYGVGALILSRPLVGQLLFVSHCVLLLVNSPIPECRVHQVTATLNKDSLIVSLVVYIPQARLRETSGINLVMHV